MKNGIVDNLHLIILSDYFLEFQKNRAIVYILNLTHFHVLSDNIFMSKRDFFHNTVCEVLGNDGWHITDDPLHIKWGGATIKIDIGAERLIAAERGDEKIAVEIKSFMSRSPLSEFHTALGQ